MRLSLFMAVGAFYTLCRNTLRGSLVLPYSKGPSSAAPYELGLPQPMRDPLSCPLARPFTLSTWQIRSLRRKPSLFYTQETSLTVGELKASWAACLHSLCGRLRISVPVVHAQGDRTGSGRLPVGGQKLKTSQTTRTVGTGTAEEPPGVSEESFAEAVPLQRPLSTSTTKQQQQYMQEDLSANAAANGQKLPAENTHAAQRVDSSSSCDEPDGRTVRAIPLLRKRQASSTIEAEAGGLVWLDNTTMRVGARVPWGRLHRGRFAKVNDTTIRTQLTRSSLLGKIRVIAVLDTRFSCEYC